MIQTLVTLLFLLAAGAGVAVITASLIDDWSLLTRALGFGGVRHAAPLPPQIWPVAARQTNVVRFTPRPGDRRAAA